MGEPVFCLLMRIPDHNSYGYRLNGGESLREESVIGRLVESTLSRDETPSSVL